MQQEDQPKGIPESLYQQRMGICRKCTHRLTRIVPIIEAEIWQCGKCLCVLHIKARMRSQHCPIEKW